MSGGGPCRVRFAPSPTGSLHLGNARTALFNWLVARRSGGTLILRIEDTDRERHQDAAEAAILDDLRWLGLDWDEGPDRDGGHGPYRQSERGDLYAAAVGKLLEADRAYACVCDDPGSERESQHGAAAARCPCADRPAPTSGAGEPHAVRFRSFPRGAAGVPVGFADRLRGPVEVPPDGLGDPVILRRDGRPTYNFAVVVDDAAMGVDLVIRGDDHLSNTPRQVLMFEALGHGLPEFAHLPMVRGEDGTRLSKRHGAVSVGEYRRCGYPPEALVNALALLGWAPPGGDKTIVRRDELLESFDLDRVNRSAAAFDPAKLDWISNQHLQAADVAALAAPVTGALVEAGLLPGSCLSDPELAGFREGVAGLVQSALERYDQAPARAAALFARGGDPADPASAEAAHSGVDVIAELARRLAENDRLDLDGWRALKKDLSAATGVKGKGLFHPVRVALTGATSGPELDRLVPLIVEGHQRLPRHVPGLAERAARTAEWLAGLPG